MQPFYTLNQNTISLIADFLPIKDILKLKILCKFSYKNLSLDQHHILRKMNWDFICSKPHSENFIEKYTAYINWDVICVFQKLSIEFMKKHWEELYIDRIYRYQTLDEEMIRILLEKGDELHLPLLFPYQKISQNLLFDILEKLKSQFAKINNTLLASQFLDTCIEEIIKNQNLPFSVIKKEFDQKFILLALKKQNYKFSEIKNHLGEDELKSLAYSNAIVGKEKFFDTDKELLEYLENALYLIDWTKTKITPRVMKMKKTIIQLYDTKIDGIMNRIFEIKKIIDEEDPFSVEYSIKKLGGMMSDMVKKRYEFKINTDLREKLDFNVIDNYKSYINWYSFADLPLVDESVLQKYMENVNKGIFAKKQFSKEFYEENINVIKVFMMFLADKRKTSKVFEKLLKVGVDCKKLPQRYLSISALFKKNIVTFEELGENLNNWFPDGIIDLVTTEYVPQWLCIKIAKHLEEKCKNYENMFVHQHFTEETIDKMKKLGLDLSKYRNMIGMYQRLSEKFMDENMDLINLSLCMVANKVSLQFIEKHWDKIEWREFIGQTSFVENIEKTYPEIYPRFKKSLEEYIKQREEDSEDSEDEDISVIIERLTKNQNS